LQENGMKPLLNEQLTFKVTIEIYDRIMKYGQGRKTCEVMREIVVKFLDTVEDKEDVRNTPEA
jgi:hypothetical protein